MEALYEVLHKGGVGLFESPTGKDFPLSTLRDHHKKSHQRHFESFGFLNQLEVLAGTGKTLSLICGSLKWLEEYRQAQKEAKDAALKREKGKALFPCLSNVILLAPQKVCLARAYNEAFQGHD